MARIGMQLDEIRSVSGQYGKYSEEISQLISALKTSQGQLNSSWEGQGFNEFQLRFEELLPNVESFQQLLEEINKFLATSANTLEDADNAIAAAAGR